MKTVEHPGLIHVRKALSGHNHWQHGNQRDSMLEGIGEVPGLGPLAREPTGRNHWRRGKQWNSKSEETGVLPG